MNAFSDLFHKFFHSEKVGGLLLVVCTVVSLLLANTGAADSYTGFFHHKAGPGGLHLSFEHWINDGLMAIFFLMVGLEVERELYVGELADLRKATLPVVAAIGGMVLPSLIHFAFNAGRPTQSGFAIPMATDIAFALGILSLAGRRAPAAVRVFLAALAIIDDIGAVLVIAFFYTKEIQVGYLLAGLGIFGGLLVLNRLRVRRLAAYLMPGVLLWYCFLQSGVHATISGILLAFAIPFHEEDGRNISLRLQNALHLPVAFIILPLFALANTAIRLPNDLGGALGNRNAMGVMLGLFAGKVAGIALASWIVVKLGFASLQEGLSWRKLAGAGFLGGIGFTMSMFIANLSFSDPGLVTASKLGILLASTASAVVGLVIFFMGKKTPAAASGSAA